MKKEELNKRLAEELEHIPRGHRGSPQNLLRAAYNMVRRHDLSVDPAISQGASLKKALEEIGKTAPDFMPAYDTQFFST